MRSYYKSSGHNKIAIFGVSYAFASLIIRLSTLVITSGKNWSPNLSLCVETGISDVSLTNWPERNNRKSKQMDRDICHLKTFNWNSNDDRNKN